MAVTCRHIAAASFRANPAHGVGQTRGEPQKSSCFSHSPPFNARPGQIRHWWQFWTPGSLPLGFPRPLADPDPISSEPFEVGLRILLSGAPPCCPSLHGPARGAAGRFTGSQTTSGGSSGMVSGTSRDTSGRVTGTSTATGKCQSPVRVSVPPKSGR